MLGFDFSKKSSFGVLAISCCMAGVAIILHFSGTLADFENVTQDLRTRWRYALKEKAKKIPVNQEIALAAIDQKALDPGFCEYSDRWNQGRWLTRENYFEPVSYFFRHFDPRVVSYDILLPQNRSRGGKGYEEVGKEIDAYINAHKLPWGQLLNNEDFPSNKLFSAVDEVYYSRFIAMIGNFYDQLEEAHQKSRPLIFAYDLTRSSEDGSSAWKLDESSSEDGSTIWKLDESSSFKINWLKKFALPASCLKNVPPNYNSADNAEMPPKDFSSTPANLGNIATPRDPDAKVRRVPLLDGFRDPRDGKIYFVPSLSLQTCLDYLDIKPGKGMNSGIEVIFGKEVHLWNAVGRELHIPIDQQGRLLLNFESKIQDFVKVPYIDVIRAGKFLDQDVTPPGALMDVANTVKESLHEKIVFVGVTATGIDTGACSIDDHTPLVFIHMTAVDNILRQSFLLPLKVLPTIVFLTLCPLFVGIFTLQSSARRSTVATGIFLSLVLAVSFALFYFNISLIPVVTPTLTILATFGLDSIYVYQVERKGRLEIRKKFSKMVSPKVLQFMEEHPESLSGERREATMFFSDVAGFTAMSESISPDQLSKILNDYLTPMTNIILARDGYVNKYAGDGIMAIWGVPYPSNDHAVMACLAAIDQQAKIRELAPVFLEKYSVKLHVRMGINTGVVSAGNMGSEERYEYTVMGDAVNFAARLEPANKDYSTLIMIGVKTYEEAKDAIVARKLDKIGVYGKTEAVLVYELVGAKGKVSDKILELIRTYEEGLDLYWKREFTEAIERFEKCLSMKADDMPSKVFIERASEFIINPPGSSWSGEYVRKGK